jgi:hypothetical protein
VTRAYQLLAKRKFHEALAVLEPLLERDDHGDGSVWVNAIYAALPSNLTPAIDVSRLRRIVERCLPHGKRAPNVFLNAAFAYCEIGDLEPAMRCLRLEKKHGADLKPFGGSRCGAGCTGRIIACDVRRSWLAGPRHAHH